jgi:hypothetical protein
MTVRTIAPTNPQCRGELHSATEYAWTRRCRCKGALSAHEQAKARRREARRKVVAHFESTGECTASSHDSRRAYTDLGCRCPLAVKLNDAWVARKPKKTTRLELFVDGRRLVVGRISLMMLMHGYPDNPTPGERIVASLKLSQRIVSDGPRTWRHLTRAEVGERIGVNDRTIYRYKRTVDKLRAERHLRRLADVQRKAERVQRAIERGR